MVSYRSVTSAIIMGLAYQSAWPMAIIGLIPLFNAPIKKRDFFIWGTVYMAVLHLFLLQLADDANMLIAIFLLLLTSVYFGCFYGLGGVLLHAIQRQTKRPWWVFLPLVWPIIEYAKGMGPYGNPHGDFGFIPSAIANHIPLYAVVGHLGIGMLIAMINGLIYTMFTQRNKAKPTVAMAVVMILMMGLVSSPNKAANDHAVHVVQTGINQHLKQNRHNWPMLEQHYLAQLSPIQNGIVIMPETILPTTMSNRPFYTHLQHLTNHANINLLFGTFINNDFNGAVLMQPNQATQLYKKQQLMPFGEVLPLSWLLSPLIPSAYLFNNFKRGPSPVILSTQSTTIRPIICLEGIYPRFYRMNTPGMVAILANNAWFNHSSAGRKLLQFARVNAAQFQVPVLLSANFGESAIISSSGTVLQHSPHHRNATLSHTIFTNQYPSLYQRWPWLGISIIALTWWMMVLRIIKPSDL